MTALDLAKDWLRIARSDITTAKHMFDNVHPKEIEISCYHSQQCAEKSLKAYLVSKMIEPPHTHDLVDLCNRCAIQDASFSAIQQYCVFLNPYGVHVRYPNELAVDETITKMAIEKSQEIFDFCDNLLKEMDK